MKGKPFLKWAGGKSKLLKDIKKHLPSNFNETIDTYIEPFVGGGAVMLWVLQNYPNIQTYIINDINEDLINTYHVVRNDPRDLVIILKKIENEYHILSEDLNLKSQYYYKKRDLYNLRTSSSIEQAALFIFLNRTCFNGLFRVNKKNQFNVPIGSYDKPLICDTENLFLVSELLQKVTILNVDFYETLEYVTPNCFFYLDPPYKPISKTSNFNKYSNFTFDDNQQIKLKEFCSILNENDIKWILSNSDLKNNKDYNSFFDDLYNEFTINRIEVNRVINNTSKDKFIKELLITNNSNT